MSGAQIILSILAFAGLGMVPIGDTISDWYEKRKKKKNHSANFKS
jgi:hypothetical protein